MYSSSKYYYYYHYYGYCYYYYYYYYYYCDLTQDHRFSRAASKLSMASRRKIGLDIHAI